jgi:hypothetical protein
MQNLIGLIVLIKSFPMVGGMPCGSSWLRSYSLLKMNPLKYGQEAPRSKVKEVTSWPQNQVKEKSCCKQEVTGRLKDQVKKLLGRV